MSKFFVGQDVMTTFSGTPTAHTVTDVMEVRSKPGEQPEQAAVFYRVTPKVPMSLGDDPWIDGAWFKPAK